MKDLGMKNYHPTGTSITVEGPRFSSKAESKWFQSLGASVVNMTTIPEVFQHIVLTYISYLLALSMQ